jgi:hypothetical protein
MATPKTILLTVNDVNANYRPTYEALAAESITPGHLVNMASTGKIGHFANTVKWTGLLVVENEYTAESSTSAIDVAYAADANAYYVIPARGDSAYCVITDGETIAIGDLLVPGNDTGKLVERTTEDLDLVVAVALEAVSPSGADGRCRVRFTH